MMIIRIILIALGIALFVSYTVYAVKKGGMPKSLSQTFYRLELYKKDWMFQATLIGMGILFMPAWIMSSPDWCAFMGVLCCFSIIFVGAFARYLRMKEDKYIHTSCAWFAAAISICWSIFSYKWLWISPVACGIVFGTLALIYRKSYYFWLEMGAFTSTFISLIVSLFLV